MLLALILGPTPLYYMVAWDNVPFLSVIPNYSSDFGELCPIADHMYSNSM